MERVGFKTTCILILAANERQKTSELKLKIQKLLKLNHSLGSRVRTANRVFLVCKRDNHPYLGCGNCMGRVTYLPYSQKETPRLNKNLARIWPNLHVN